MKKVFLVFEGDEWLSASSMVLMGIFSTQRKAVKAIMNEMSQEHMFNEEFTMNYVRNYLAEEWQTPCLPNRNYIIATANLNEWGEI